MLGGKARDIGEFQKRVSEPFPGTGWDISLKGICVWGNYRGHMSRQISANFEARKLGRHGKLNVLNIHGAERAESVVYILRANDRRGELIRDLHVAVRNRSAIFPT